ncbi:MAG: haloalkane dehalogenase [Archangium sp.]
MEILRTPDDRFAALPDFPFAPKFVEVEPSLRMSYVDEGSGPVVLLLHGEPTWSFLYRKMIPPLVAAGFRVIAPDLIGFGRSDKLASQHDYSVAKHVGWVSAFIEKLQLTDVSLFCQDWGAQLGLRIVAAQPNRFGRVAVGNGTLSAGQGKPNLKVRVWRVFAAHSPFFPISSIIARGCKRPLSPEVLAAYDAPFPSEKFKAAARRFPALLPLEADHPAMPDSRVAWEQLGKWDKPFVTLFGDVDPFLGGHDRMLQAHVPGARGQPHEVLDGGHFIQEDQGPHLATSLVSWLRSLSVGARQ